MAQATKRRYPVLDLSKLRIGNNESHIVKQPNNYERNKKGIERDLLLVPMLAKLTCHDEHYSVLVVFIGYV